MQTMITTSHAKGKVSMHVFGQTIQRNYNFWQ